mmetsp:Transcript_10750/g.28441  ORF Transcript_10750/g.28441 Transcript_10750/m.28441 type:complete len:268 (+) Transcript_10750:1596-2399(+)
MRLHDRPGARGAALVVSGLNAPVALDDATAIATTPSAPRVEFAILRDTITTCWQVRALLPHNVMPGAEIRRGHLERVISDVPGRRRGLGRQRGLGLLGLFVWPDALVRLVEGVESLKRMPLRDALALLGIVVFTLFATSTLAPAPFAEARLLAAVRPAILPCVLQFFGAAGQDALMRLVERIKLLSRMPLLHPLAFLRVAVCPLLATRTLGAAPLAEPCLLATSFPTIGARVFQDVRVSDNEEQPQPERAPPRHRMLARQVSARRRG